MLNGAHQLTDCLPPPVVGTSSQSLLPTVLDYNKTAAYQASRNAARSVLSSSSLLVVPASL